MLAAPLVVGLALGVRHALEPDHLAALSTLTAEARGRGGRSGIGLGALWGLGHSAALLLVAGTLASIGAVMPPRLEQLFEFLVSLMIIGLGVRAVFKAIEEGRRGRVHSHAHGELAHTHAAPAQHVHLSRTTLATRPLLIGLLHGLAGSGALTALVTLELPTATARLLYIALFGLGSVVGMAVLTGFAGLHAHRLVQRPQVAAALLLVTGTLSTLVGLWWGHASLSQLAG